MFGFCLGAYYGFVLGFLGAVAYRHWISLYDGPTPRIHEEPYTNTPQPHWRRNGP